MSSLITNTFTTATATTTATLLTDAVASHNHTQFQHDEPPPNLSYTTIATAFLNDTWLQIEKTASALIATTITDEHWNAPSINYSNTINSSSNSSSNSGSSYTGSSTTDINNSPPSLNSMKASLTADATERFSSGTSSSSSISPLFANIFENFINTTTTTTTTTMASTYNTSSIMSTLNASLDNDLVAATATETPYVPYVMRPETYIVPVLFAFIFFVGVLGNGTLIIVFLRVRQMRNVPNTYIFSLALADLLVIVTTVPLTSTVYTVDSWPWGSVLCTLSEYFKDVSIGVSVFTLTALSGDRYFAIVDPLRKFHAHGGGKRATRMTIAIALSIWLLAIMCGLPALIGTYVKKVDINSSKSFSLCYPFPEKWGIKYAKTMVLLRFLVYYAIPLVIIAVFYALIARHLMYAANVPGEVHGAVRQVRARRKVALTVLAFVVIFGICFLPIHVFMLWFYYWPTAQEDYNYFWHVLRIVAFCLSFANSCANPVALYFVSGAFRKHFNRYLFCEGSRSVCKHRDTSLTASRRYYHSRRSCFNQSTIRSRLQETTITMLTNGNNQNGCNNVMGGNGGSGMASSAENCRNEDTIDVALTSDYCQQHQHTHQLM